LERHTNSLLLRRVPAFQCGAATLAADVAPEADALRLRDEAQRYARALTTIAPSEP
jgi:hypothetical protein